MDIAQEEVLTCLGIYLCERLHRIKQKLRAEEQTWQILFCIGVDALRKNFEVCVVLLTCLIYDHCHCEQAAVVVVDSAADFQIPGLAVSSVNLNGVLWKDIRRGVCACY